MASLQSHLSVLESSASQFSSSPVFRIPQVDEATSKVVEWLSVSYLQFRLDVERYARHWSSLLSSEGIPRNSVVGLWLGGMTYVNVLQIYGMSRAGYIPQLFSLRLPNPAVIYELLAKAGARALVYEPSFGVDLSECLLPIYAADAIGDSDVEGVDLPDMPRAVSEDQCAFIFHTSGSTSGSPKLVPCSYQWLDAIVSKTRHVGRPKSAAKQDVTVWMGSMCHIGQTFMLIGSLSHGACTIQPTKIAFSSEELMEMIHRCGLNRLNQFATFLGNHLRISRKDSKLLSTIAGLDEVLYSGLPLAKEEEAWAIQNGVPLKNLFGSTECGAMMLSIGGKESRGTLLCPIEGTSYGFFPIAGDATEVDPAYKNINAQLLELVILSESGDCPDSSLRQADGHFHTGDLFLEVEPGCYASQGRVDDWIKSENSLRCDTKSIEDNVRATCAELVSECVVVGNGRPSPTLFVEPSDTCTLTIEKLKKDIIRKTRQFHSRRYVHERITSTDYIVVVEKGTLPRTATKGNIRRKAVEEKYKSVLDDIYGKVPRY